MVNFREVTVITPSSAKQNNFGQHFEQFFLKIKYQQDCELRVYISLAKLYSKVGNLMWNLLQLEFESHHLIQ